jgi:hypothetical protein
MHKFLCTRRYWSTGSRRHSAITPRSIRDKALHHDRESPISRSRE